MAMVEKSPLVSMVWIFKVQCYNLPEFRRYNIELECVGIGGYTVLWVSSLQYDTLSCAPQADHTL